MQIKICKADKAFSLFIRARDKKCVRCLRAGDLDKRGLPILGLQCSHFFGRAKESVRFDQFNADSLCMGCHQYWGSTDREAYRDFKVKQLGQKQFDFLCVRASQLITCSKKEFREQKYKEFTNLMRQRSHHA